MGRGDDGMKCIEVRTLLKKGAYADALDVVETINIDKVKSIVNLKAIASAYERVGEYAKAKAVLLQSYDIKRTKMTVYRLAYLSIKTEEFEDADIPYYMLPMSGLEDFVETMVAIKGVLILLTVLFVAAIALDIMYIVFHILNKKGAGFGAIPLHVIWLLIGAFPVFVTNMAMMEEFDVKILRLSPAPFIAIVLVVASTIIWYYASKDLTILNIQGED